MVVQHVTRPYRRRATPRQQTQDNVGGLLCGLAGSGYGALRSNSISITRYMDEASYYLPMIANAGVTFAFALGGYGLGYWLTRNCREPVVKGLSKVMCSGLLAFGGEKISHELIGEGMNTNYLPMEIESNVKPAPKIVAFCDGNMTGGNVRVAGVVGNDFVMPLSTQSFAPFA